MKIALVGFGDVGQAFATELLKWNHVSVAAFDTQFLTKGGWLWDHACAMGVQAVDCPSLGACHADVVISAVAADECEEAAMAAADCISPGQYYFDLNSSSPRTKQRAASHIECAGGLYVEGAIMAPVAERGLHVPILSGGAHAMVLATRLNPLGMSITPFSADVGRVSAAALCRNLLVEGLEALLDDCLAIARHAGVEKAVYQSLAGDFPSVDWAGLVQVMRPDSTGHQTASTAEMLEAADMMDEFGYDGRLERALAFHRKCGTAGKVAQ